jgi:hypothetical protein
MSAFFIISLLLFFFSLLTFVFFIKHCLTGYQATYLCFSLFTAVLRHAVVASVVLNYVHYSLRITYTFRLSHIVTETDIHICFVKGILKYHHFKEIVCVSYML